MLGGKIEISQFQNHIDHTYPNGHWVQAEWERIKKDIAEALKPSHNVCPSQKLLSSIAQAWCKDGILTKEYNKRLYWRLMKSVAQNLA